MNPCVTRGNMMLSPTQPVQECQASDKQRDVLGSSCCGSRFLGSHQTPASEANGKNPLPSQEHQEARRSVKRSVVGKMKGQCQLRLHTRPPARKLQGRQAAVACGAKGDKEVRDVPNVVKFLDVGSDGGPSPVFSAQCANAQRPVQPSEHKDFCPSPRFCRGKCAGGR